MENDNAILQDVTPIFFTDSNDVFVLKWNSVTGATQYKVFRADGANGEEPLQYVGTFTQNGYAEYVEPGTAVTYGVAAINSNGCESAQSIKTGIKGTNPGNSGPTYYYYTEDHLGSVRLVLDANGNIISRLDYEPYGTLLPKTSPASISSPENKILYTGQERDSFTGHDNMHFRHYASRIGRFMKPDNMMGDLGNTQSWNLYSYVRGNPVNYNDPTGHLPPGALTDWTVYNTQTEEQLNKFDAARQEGLSLLNVGEAWSETAEAVGAGASTEEIAYAALKDTIRTVVAIDLAVTGAKILGGVASKAVTKTVTTQTASKTAGIGETPGGATSEAVSGSNAAIRTTRSGESGARITRPDGSEIDITPTRVKEYVPNTHPNAPEGSLQRVKFENAQPGSKGYKRNPTTEDLRLLEETLKSQGK